MLLREDLERVLAAEREHEILARDPQLAGDVVDGRQRDQLERLAKAVRIARSTLLARIRNWGRLERPAAEREVRERRRPRPARPPRGTGSARFTTLRRTKRRGHERAQRECGSQQERSENALVT